MTSQVIGGIIIVVTNLTKDVNFLNVSTTTWVLDTRLGYKEAAKLLKEAGFKYYDLKLYPNPELSKEFLLSENYKNNALEFKAFADSLGICCNQAHAPYPSSDEDEQKNGEIFDSIVRSIEVASILGAKIIVVHPIQHLNYAENQRELFKLNVEFYKKLIPYAEKFGIKIATENMWQLNLPTKVPTDSVCSRAWEFCELIDAIDSEWLVGCLDIGHASLMNANIPEFIRELGNKRLLALHIHDTNLQQDSHTLPFTQKIDFEPILKALGEIDYRGDVTFEAGHFFKPFPNELLPSAAKLLYDTGKYLADRIDSYR